MNIQMRFITYMDIKNMNVVILRPSDNENWLTQKDQSNLSGIMFSKQIVLSEGDSAENWMEITDEDKMSIESALNQANNE